MIAALFIRKQVQLEQEKGIPIYQTLDLFIDSYSANDKIISNANVNYKEYQVSNKNRSQLTFYYSSVTLQNSEFVSLYAFGSEFGYGDGSSGYFSHCTASIEESSFENSFAANGGSLVFLYSNAYIINSKFTSNRASKYAGSIFVQGKENEENFDHYSLQLQKCNFINNTANLGGAIISSSLECLYIESNSFINNTSFTSGGALFIINSQAFIFVSDFIGNIVKSVKSSITIVLVMISHLAKCTILEDKEVAQFHLKVVQ